MWCLEMLSPWLAQSSPPGGIGSCLLAIIYNARPTIVPAISSQTIGGKLNMTSPRVEANEQKFQVQNLICALEHDIYNRI